MKKKYILSIAMISVMLALLFSACNASNPLSGLRGPSSSGSGSLGLSGHDTFEFWAGRAADVVVAEFVTQRRFKYAGTEFEFIVHERIFGDAADTIFVYTWDEETGGPENDPQFAVGAQYLLLLETIAGVFSTIHDDGFMFLGDLVLDLNNPSVGTMYNQPLSLHSTGLNFNSRNLTKERIISYVSTLPRDPIPQRLFIKSDILEDIITGSPHVLIVEIGEPYRLTSIRSGAGIRLPTDIYNATVVEVLKGDWQVGGLVEVVVFADTVFPGETHIVSIAPSNPTNAAPSGLQRLSSRNSLHSMSQLDEINLILGNVADITFDLNGGSATAGNEDDFAPQTIAVNTTVTQPVSDPVREHHQFTNWYTQATGGVPFNFSTSIAEDTVIYARWTAELAAPPTGTTPQYPTLSPSPYIPWTPRTGTPDCVYTAYGDDNDDAPGEAATPPVFIPPPPSINTLIFTVGSIEYLLRNQPRTSVGIPFIDPATDRMMIPLRTLSEALDVAVEWCSDTRSAVVHLPTGTLAIPANELLPDGMGSAIIVNDRIFVPIRFVMYAFDADVAWDSANRAAVITW